VGTLLPVRKAVIELVDELTPIARRLGCEDELLGAGRILDHGPSYLRQRRLVAAGASLVDVVDSLVEELRTDHPSG
jgi:glutamate---cysteine ligase / carboxylate-amine ligase